MLKLYAKSQSIIISCVFPFHRVLVVANVCTSSVPASSILLGFVFRVDDWPHPVIVEGVWLHEVDDVKSVGLTSSGVAHSEVIPLSITSCIIIWLEN